MTNLCTLPMEGSPTFSCEMEMMLWLLRHQENELVQAWWIGFEFGDKGRTWERTLARLENGI